ncbi:MAG: type II toxin-antitoxin system VapC family toxin [Chloroflexi bacterium]|jgi:predicted nucleic acid-binding protein|nr:type II toxin-antitoxin system VapC family toxin [Chloroflexota bacterium]
MNVVDSSGWLEYLAGERNKDFFAPPIRDVGKLIVPTICMYEVFKRFLNQRNEEDALMAIGIMSLGNAVQLTREIAIDAAQISAETKLAMTDSIILATVRAHTAMLWTQDKDFEGMEGVRYVEKVG